MKIITPSGTKRTSPLLFCLGMFFVAVFFSVFACSAIYYAVRTDDAGSNKQQLVQQPSAKQQPFLASIMK